MGVDQACQVIGDPLCAYLLYEPYYTAYQQHRQNDRHRRYIAAEGGRRKRIGHKGDCRQYEKDDSKGVDEGSAQTIPYGIR